MRESCRHAVSVGGCRIRVNAPWPQIPPTVASETTNSLHSLTLTTREPCALLGPYLSIMAASSSKKRGPKAAVDNLAEGSSSTPSRLDVVSKAIMAPFTSRKHDSNKIFSDCKLSIYINVMCIEPSRLVAPAIMTPRMMNAAATVSGRARSTIGSSTGSSLNFATLGRAPLRLGLGSRRVTSRDLQIFEVTEELLHEEVPEPEGVAQDVSLLRGFNATIPSSEKGRTRRRQTRNVETPKLGLKRLGMGARGMLGDEEEHEGESVASEEDMVVVGRSDARGRVPKAKKKRGRQSLSAGKVLGKDELVRQTHEIERDKENLHVRRVSLIGTSESRSYCLMQQVQTLVNAEIVEITHKIEALDAIRTKLEQDLLRLQEDELELDDECQYLIYV